MPKDDLDDDILDDHDDVLDDQADLPEDLDEEDLEELDDEEEEVIDDEAIIEDDDIETDDIEEDVADPVEAKVGRDDEEDDEEEEDEDSDDVEASLDVILKERLVVVDDDDDDEDEEEVGDPDERGDSPLRVLPKQPGEFVCQSCFLVKHPSQLADEARMLCRDPACELAAPTLAGQDRSVTEPHSPLEAALDLFVYAPVGLALTAAEEIPKLAAKGRAQLGGRLAMAKVVGQFAVSQGRKELTRRFATPAGSGWPGPPARQPRPGPAPVPRQADPVPTDVAFDDLLAVSDQEVGERNGRIGPPADAATVTPETGAPAGPGPTVDPSGLAIPGYDSLAASHVVQRLAGLSPTELAAVGAYESSHRARRTILTRVRQLQER